MVDRNEHEIDIDANSRMQDDYSSLLREARKQAREAGEDNPDPTKKEIWVEDGAIHWRVKVCNEYGRACRNWAKGTIPLPEESKEPEEDLSDRLAKISKLHEKGHLTDDEFKKAKKKLLD